MGLRVWRLGTAAAEVQYRKLMSTLPGAKATDEVGDASFRAKSGDDRRRWCSWCASAAWWCR